MKSAMTGKDTSLKSPPAVWFWGVCIPIRTAIALASLWLGYAYPTKALPILAAYTGATAIGFAYNAVLACMGRKSVGGLGGPVWWTELRYVHTVLWGVTSVAAGVFRLPWAGSILLVDVMVGIT